MEQKLEYLKSIKEKLRNDYNDIDKTYHAEKNKLSQYLHINVSDNYNVNAELCKILELDSKFDEISLEDFMISIFEKGIDENCKHFDNLFETIYSESYEDYVEGFAPFKVIIIIIKHKKSNEVYHINCSYISDIEYSIIEDPTINVDKYNNYPVDFYKDQQLIVKNLNKEKLKLSIKINEIDDQIKLLFKTENERLKTLWDNEFSNKIKWSTKILYDLITSDKPFSKVLKDNSILSAETRSIESNYDFISNIDINKRPSMLYKSISVKLSNNKTAKYMFILDEDQNNVYLATQKLNHVDISFLTQIISEIENDEELFIEDKDCELISRLYYDLTRADIINSIFSNFPDINRVYTDFVTTSVSEKYDIDIFDKKASIIKNIDKFTGFSKNYIMALDK